MSRSARQSELPADKASLIYGTNRAICRASGVPRSNQQGAASVVPPLDEALFSPIYVAAEEMALVDREYCVDVRTFHMKVRWSMFVGINMNLQGTGTRNELADVVERAISPDGVPATKQLGKHLR